MHPRTVGDEHAPPRPPATPHPGIDPHEHPTEPPDDVPTEPPDAVPLEPRSPHPGTDPIEAPTEPRQKHPSRRIGYLLKACNGRRPGAPRANR